MTIALNPNTGLYSLLVQLSDTEAIEISQSPDPEYLKNAANAVSTVPTHFS